MEPAGAQKISTDESAVPHGTGLKTVQITHERDPGLALIAPLELRVLSGQNAGLVYRAGAERFVIGVHERADLVLTDTTVSRFHCEIAIEGERVAIRDMGSRNGTWVDGVPVVHAYLRVGSKISVGCTEIELGLGKEPIELPIAKEDRFGAMVGRSVQMRTVFSRLERAAQIDSTVLITGETGTGKEIAAEGIHQRSARKDGPFVIFDCSAIPAALIESELFGHEKGAFTGAIGTRQGAFEAANGGTIFLDEIGELTPELQPKLLRLLERRHVKRVGGNERIPVDVRVIAATNRNLQSEVNERRFRADLYYRLAVVEIRLPPLRERPEDMELLVETILEGLDAANRPEANALRTEAAREELRRHAWPGNVRELRNHVERCLAFADGTLGLGSGAAASASVFESNAVRPDLKAARQSFIQEFERRYLSELIAEHAGNVSAAARAAGIDRKYLHRLLLRYGLR